MTDTPSTNTNRISPISMIILIIFLAGLAWFSRYFLSSGFGLYEDDLTFIPAAIEADFIGVLSMIAGYFSSLAQQGRPFMWSWVVLLSHLGWQVGGLQGMYVIAFLVWLTNILLFTLLLRKIHPSLLFTAVGGIAYVLFSADTNQAFLFNAFGLQSSITFLLLALHLYVRNQKFRWGAYILLVIVILTYETPYWLFLAAPFLTELKSRALTRRLLENTLIVSLMFIVIYFLRYLSGEARVVGLGFPDMVIIPLKHMAIGPFVGLGIYFLRPILVLQNISTTLLAAVITGSVIIFALLNWLHRTTNHPGAKLKLFPINRDWFSRLDIHVQRDLRLLLAGLLMLVFAYPLTILLRSYAISGRETRVHLAAVVGASIVVTCVVMLFYSLLAKEKFRVILMALVSLVFGFNFAFGFIIQKAYVRAWDLQKAFWQEALPLVSDASDGTAILIDGLNFEDVLYIDANTWNLPRVLPQLMVFPDDWEIPPRVFRLIDNWETNIIRQPGQFSIDGNNSVAPSRTYGDYQQDRAMFLIYEENVLNRLFEVQIMEQSIQLKPAGPDVFSSLETRPLYDLIIESE